MSPSELNQETDRRGARSAARNGQGRSLFFGLGSWERSWVNHRKWEMVLARWEAGSPVSSAQFRREIAFRKVTAKERAHAYSK